MNGYGSRAVGVCAAMLLGGLLLMAPAAPAEPMVAAAGDIACKTAPTTSGSSCHYGAVSNVIASDPAVTDVLPLGDVQYDCGDYPLFLRYYDPTWGRFKGISHPVPGNHEYDTGSGCDPSTTTPAKGYFDYFNGVGNPTGPAGDRAKGYYAYQAGTWRMIALNSNCSKISCSTGSAQETWLRSELAADAGSCILAYWHHPRFSSRSGATSSVQPLWQDLYDAHAAVVLTGHDHFYERFARLGRTGTGSGGLVPVADPVGVREFVVGTGGHSLFSFGTIRAASQARSKTFGVLKLTLRGGAYDWRFVPEPGSTFTDSGSDTCGGQGSPDQEPPTAPATLTAATPVAGQVNLTWSAASDDIGVTAYRVERAPVGGAFAQIAETGATTTYVDAQVAPATTYEYRVRALDAAGNVSGPSPVATVTTAAGPLIFAVAADATVKQTSPNTNYGAAAVLETDDGTNAAVQSYLRFDVSGVTGPVTSARLRVYVTNGTVDGPPVFAVSDTAWSESAITWSTRPAVGAQLDDRPALSSGAYTEYDVTAAVTGGNGSYAFAVGPTPTTDGADFRSKEATSSRPELVLTTG
jgi:hypothetical protein